MTCNSFIDGSNKASSTANRLALSYVYVVHIITAEGKKAECGAGDRLELRGNGGCRRGFL